jgi:trehalose-phosphatase
MIQCQPPRRRSSSGLPSALDHIEAIARKHRRKDRQTAVFLDYDGTLTPIVDRPEQADLSPRMRATLATLAKRCIVAIVSGRGLAEVRAKVGLDGLYYAGSHGFEIDGPGNRPLRSEKGTEFLPVLDRAEARLRQRLADIEGVLVERKKFSIAVHYRRVSADRKETVERIVDEVYDRHKALRKMHGKKVFELQPDVEWDKGRAVRWLMAQLGLDDHGAGAIYIGDDVTDEDAFRVLQGCGTGIVVHGGTVHSTYAAYGLESPRAVQRFLDSLSAAMHGSV